MERVIARGIDLSEAKAAERLQGAVLEQVEPRGKHLMLHFDNGYSIHSHLRMDGSWHVYRDGERWRKGPKAAWLVLDNGEWSAVNFHGPILEIWETRDLLRDHGITRLGPDVLAEPFDDAEFIRRMRTHDDDELGDTLMDQSAVAGIGNIYKSESCFMTLLDPWQPVRQVSDAQLIQLRETATRIMRDGVLDHRAITFRGPGPAGRWAYGRAGEPCRRCGARIQAARQGGDLRTTYWCERCQLPGELAP